MWPMGRRFVLQYTPGAHRVLMRALAGMVLTFGTLVTAAVSNLKPVLFG